MGSREQRENGFIGPMDSVRPFGPMPMGSMALLRPILGLVGPQDPSILLQIYSIAESNEANGPMN